MKVLVNKVKIDEKNRLRASAKGSVDDLAESMKEIGQIQDIVINEYYKLLAGERRLQAAKELGWTHIEAKQLKGLTPLQEFDIELHENWKRKNFTDYELSVALLKRKEIYDRMHPEATVEGRHLKRERKEDGTLGDSLAKSNEPESGLLVEPEISETKVEPAKAFAESTAEVLGLSRKTVYDKIEAAKAVEIEQVKGPEVDAWKEGKRSFSAVLGRIREKGKQEETREKSYMELREEQKKLGLENALKAIREAGIDDIIEAVNGVREEAEEEPVKLCVDCKKALPIGCPSCDHKYILCDRDWGEHELDEEACKRYE